MGHREKTTLLRLYNQSLLPQVGEGFVDLHCHCLPGLDDGPETVCEAIELCRLAVADGISVTVATPHQLGRYDGHNTADQIRSAVFDLNTTLQAERVPLTVLPGADVRIDERIGKLLAEDEVMTCADGRRYLLLELPAQAYVNPVRLLRELNDSGITCILTHPERYEHLIRNPESIFPWLDEGLLLQLTAGSIVGHFGPGPRKAGWFWLSKGVVSFIATDAHDTADRRPCMSVAAEAISSKFGSQAARTMCVSNPSAVVQGRTIEFPEYSRRVRA